MTPSRDQVGKGSIRVFIGGDHRGPRLRMKEANPHQSETTQMAIKVKRELCEAQSHLSRKLRLSTVRTRSDHTHEVRNEHFVATFKRHVRVRNGRIELDRGEVRHKLEGVPRLRGHDLAIPGVVLPKHTD